LDDKYAGNENTTTAATATKLTTTTTTEKRTKRKIDETPNVTCEDKRIRRSNRTRVPPKRF
jgi:hypothetical protein